MKKSLFYILIFFFMIFLASCISTKYNISEYGNDAKINLKNGNIIDCEIVYISDSTITFAMHENSFQNKQLYIAKKYYSININTINSITIEGLSGEGWEFGVIATQIVPPILLFTAAATQGVDNSALTFITAIPGILTALLFMESELEKPVWNQSMEISKLSEIKKYSRYPMNLSEVELNNLISRYTKKGIQNYGG
ncbi:MAG: hypothetical protein IPM32_12090 [Ignavibacteriae bacterium]|nr:hypothetical protein [Ignavibacteriota bacterium]